MQRCYLCNALVFIGVAAAGGHAGCSCLEVLSRISRREELLARVLRRDRWLHSVECTFVTCRVGTVAMLDPLDTECGLRGALQ